MAMWMLRVTAVGPGLLFSGWLSFAVPVIGPLLWLGTVLVLATGVLEEPVVRHLLRARGLTGRERNALNPVLLRLDHVGLRPAAVYITARLGRAAEWSGRRCVLVHSHLVEGLERGRLAEVRPAELIGTAVACQRLSLPRFDVAIRVGSLPIAFLAGLLRRSPLLQLLWRLRGATAFLVASVVAVTPHPPGEDPTNRMFALAAAIALGLSYVPPRAERAWRAPGLENRASARVAEALTADTMGSGEMGPDLASASPRRTVARGHSMASKVGASSAHLPTPGAGGR